MKRTGNLMSQILDLDNIALAAHKAFRGKRWKREVLDFMDDFTDNITTLRDEIADGTVAVGQYHYFTIYDPKERVICAAPLRERILHHAIMNVCHPCFDRRLIYDTYATRPGKGVYAALERLRRQMCHYRYFAKLDVRKYYDSIDHATVKRQLERMFKDRRLLQLFSRIIDSYSTTPGKGLPIGNLTSQYLANLYLSELDHHMKERAGAAVYVRYMDDVAMLDNDRDRLRGLVGEFAEYASQRLSLAIKPPVYGSSRSGLAYLGYRVRPNALDLSGRSKRRFRHKLLLYHRLYQEGRITEQDLGARLRPLIAFTEHARARAFRASCLELYPSG